MFNEQWKRTEKKKKNANVRGETRIQIIDIHVDNNSKDKSYNIATG